MDPLDQSLRSPGRLHPADNPFTTGPGQVPPHLAGRHELLIDLRDGLDRLARQHPGESRIIEARPGLGRTALLHRIHEAADDRNIDVLAMTVDGQGHLTTRDGRPATPVDVQAAAQQAEEDSRQVLVTIDDAHRAPDDAAAILRAAQEAGRGRGGAAAILAGLPNLSADVGARDPSLDRVPLLTLDLLDRGAVTDAITRPFGEHGVAVEDEAAIGVLVHSHGHPHHVQVWGRELWWTVDPHEGVTRHSVEATAPRVQRAMDQLARRIWVRCDPQERSLLEAIARTGSDRARPDDLCARLGPVDWNLTATRHRLQGRGLLAATERDEVEITWPRMGEWIEQHTSRTTVASMHLPVKRSG